MFQGATPAGRQLPRGTRRYPPRTGYGACLPRAAEPHRHSAVESVLIGKLGCGRTSVLPTWPYFGSDPAPAV
jgi:hypothetical protein